MSVEEILSSIMGALLAHDIEVVDLWMECYYSRTACILHITYVNPILNYVEETLLPIHNMDEIDIENVVMAVKDNMEFSNEIHS